MKKLKKIASMLLAATMVCASVTPVSAADGTNNNTEASGYYKGDETKGLESLPFVKIVVTDDKDMKITEDTFNFTMTPDATASGSKGNLSIKPGVVPAGSTSLSAEVETKSTDISTELTDYSVDGVLYNGTFNLKDLSFTDTNPEGIYRYTVRETTASSDHMTVGNEIYTVDLYVDSTGKIVYAQAANNGNSGNKEPIVFKNTLNLTTITIEKHLAGELLTSADKNTDFTFAIKIPEGGEDLNLTSGHVMDAYKVVNNVETSVKNIVVAGKKNENSENWDTADWSTFTLKDGEKLVIKNVPVGMIFWVKEATATGYTFSYQAVTGTTSIDGAEAKNGTAINDSANKKIATKTAKVTTAAGGNIVSVTNTKEKIDTGITVDVMPYVVVVLAAAACALLLIAKKRRNAR